MELTDAEETNLLGTAIFALHSVHLAVCISAFSFNLFLLYLLTRFTIFHDHMRIIMINLTLAVIASTFYLLVRSTIGLYQTYQKHQPDYPPQFIRGTDLPSNCAFSESVPQSLCVLFFLFPAMLVAERGYSIAKYWDYEKREFNAIVVTACVLLWIPIIIRTLIFLFQFSLPESLELCQYTMLQKTFFQRNFYFIVVSLFSLLFTFMFKFLEYKSKQAETDFISFNYSSLSIRYQLRENVKTCRFAFSLNMLFFFSFFTFFYFDQNIEKGVEVDAAAAERRQYLFLSFPLFALTYAIIFITSHRTLFENAKRTLVRWTTVPGYGEDEKMLP